MIGTYVSPVRCSYSREQAVLAYWMALDTLGVKPTVELTSVLAAHGALECGNFSGGLWNNNPGNVKASEKWEGQFTCITVNEILKGPDGKFHERWFAPEGELSGKGGNLLGAPLPVPPGHAQTRMRAFPTLDDGIADKLRFLLSPRWAPCLEPAKRGDASAYVRAIRARGYFTAYADVPQDKATPYETSVIRLVSSYRPLAERVGRGEVHTLDFPAPTTQTVSAGTAQRTNVLEPEEVAKIEAGLALWFYEQTGANEARTT